MNMLTYKRNVGFFVGLITGIIVMYFIMAQSTKLQSANQDWRHHIPRDGEKQVRLGDVISTPETRTTVGLKDKASDSGKLFRGARVLCWVMTSEKNLYTKAVHVQATWSRHCDKVLFASDHKDDTFPTIDITVKVGVSHLTAKTMKTFDYLYKNHYSDADWFMKADDDTYVIVENLRHFLSSQNTSQPLYIGHTFPWSVKQGFNSGGAGYVLSREALRRLGNRKKGQCREDHGPEDVELGRCMEKLGVKPVHVTDAKGRSRLYTTYSVLHEFFVRTGRKYKKNGALEKLDTISDTAISFHRIKPFQMYMLEYLLYRLKTHGVNTPA